MSISLLQVGFKIRDMSSFFRAYPITVYLEGTEEFIGWLNSQDIPPLPPEYHINRWDYPISVPYIFSTAPLSLYLLNGDLIDNLVEIWEGLSPATGYQKLETISFKKFRQIYKYTLKVRLL